MNVDVERIGKTTLKAAGILCVGTGIVAASAVAASCAAVGSVAGGFAVAKDLFKDTFVKRKYANPRIEKEENVNQDI